MNKQVLLAERPIGLPSESTWIHQIAKIPSLSNGEILIKNQYISLDPAMRGWIRDGKSYIDPVDIGAIMRAGTVGEVIETNNHPKFKVGDFICGWGGVQQYTVTNGDGFHVIDPTKAALKSYLGIIGMPGMTAYFGILKVAELKEGDIVLVSGAAGAVGSLVGQIAKIKGCRVVGIAGGPEKCAWLKEEAGFDAVIDYKAGDVDGQIKASCPDKFDVFFDNVGGDVLDAALDNIAKGARVVICGAISQYNDMEHVTGPRLYLRIPERNASMIGFTVDQYADQFPKMEEDISGWIKEGKINLPEHVIEGVDNFPGAIVTLMSGGHMGKLLVAP